MDAEVDEGREEDGMDEEGKECEEMEESGGDEEGRDEEEEELASRALMSSRIRSRSARRALLTRMISSSMEVPSIIAKIRLSKAITSKCMPGTYWKVEPSGRANSTCDIETSTTSRWMSGTNSTVSPTR